MSEENLETVRAIYGRWSQGDFRAALEEADPDVLFVMPPSFPDSGTYLGLARLREYTRGFLEAWSHITIEAEEMIEAGDSIVVAVRQRGTGVGSRAETDFLYYQVWSLRGHKVIRLENFRERADALKAVGLTE